MRTIVFALAALVSQIAVAAEGDFARSMQVEKLAQNSYRVTCNVEYFDTNAKSPYYVMLSGGGTGQAQTFPYGGQVSPTIPRLYITGADWELEVVLRKRSLLATLTFDYNYPPSSSTSAYCQGGAQNLTTGASLPHSLTYDQIVD